MGDFTSLDRLSDFFTRNSLLSKNGLKALGPSKWFEGKDTEITEFILSNGSRRVGLIIATLKMIAEKKPTTLPSIARIVYSSIPTTVMRTRRGHSQDVRKIENKENSFSKANLSQTYFKTVKVESPIATLSPIDKRERNKITSSSSYFYFTLSLQKNYFHL